MRFRRALGLLYVRDYPVQVDVCVEVQSGPTVMRYPGTEFKVGGWVTILSE